MRLITTLLLAATALSACATSQFAEPALPEPADAPDTAALPGSAQAKLDAVRPKIEADRAFAGLYVEGQTGEYDEPDRAIVMFTGDAAAHLKRYTRDPFFVPKSAAIPYDTLVKTQEDVTAAMQREKLYFMSAYTDVKKNVVVIDVVDERDVRGAVQAGKVKAPGYVLFNPVGGYVAHAQNIDPVKYFVQMRNPAGASMAALGRGTLMVMDGCLRLVSLTDKRGRLVVWPSSAIITREGGDVRITDQVTGSTVRSGQLMEIGGGHADEIQHEWLTSKPPKLCDGPYWIAGTHWKEVAPN